MNHSLTWTFCKKTEHQVRKLVAGPGVYICDACIQIADEIVSETPPPPRVSRWRGVAGFIGRMLRTASTRSGVRFAQATGVSGA